MTVGHAVCQVVGRLVEDLPLLKTRVVSWVEMVLRG
jgi:hypothetical protein